MTAIELHYNDVRSLAKKLGTRLDGKVKHTDIIDDIASLLGMRGDAMMHALKTGKSEQPVIRAAPDYTWGGNYDPAFKLETLKGFREKFFHHMSDLTTYHVSLGVIDLYSYDAVLEAHGHEVAQRHLLAFAEPMQASLLHNNKVFGKLEGKQFLVGWPIIQGDDDAEKQVKAMISELRQRLDRHLKELGVEVIGLPHAYTVGLYSDLEPCFEFELAVEQCKGKAERLAKVRAEYPFMHQYQFVYRNT